MFRRNLPLLLLKSREALMARFRLVLTRYGLTEQQWRILRALYEFKALEPRELCQHCCILSPSMAGIIQRMVDMDLIVKKRHPTDNRRVIVEMLPNIEPMVKEIITINEKVYTDLETQLGKENILELYRSLDILLNTLE